MEVSASPLHDLLEVSLSDFERWFIARFAITTEQAKESLRLMPHEAYLALWQEFEAAGKQECEAGNAR